MTTGDPLTLSGTDELKTYLARVGASASDVDAALIEHGREVTTVAQSLAPVRTGGLRASITATTQPGTLTVDAGAVRAPHAYTHHAVALGKSNGYMAFNVPSHSRRGAFGVTAYKATRRIPNKPYLFMAWEQRLRGLHDKITTALADVIRGG